ncbi:MAG TPA: glutamate-1-semialdehyde 2,1-aminomutase [Candidatus Hypogeohydataceae bacterium YC40]
MLAATNKLCTKRSEEAFKEAQKHIPGGVNSPVRAFGPVGRYPLFIKSGSGCRITDIDENSYIDYVCSWGPLILGHAHPKVIQKVKSVAEKGTSFGAPTELETQLARLIKEAMPSIEKVRFVNSGTEATMSAIRLARAFTGRELVVKFEGCYHGHVDSLLIKAGSGAATLGIPTSPGIPECYVNTTVVIPYNNLQAVETICKEKGRETACIILEPVAGNMGVVPPRPGYLEGLWKLTRAYGILLIFDEVMTGFRVTPGGAQELYGIRPDLTTLGKIIGGGLPVGAYGGRADIMDKVAPLGAVYQAGTLSGNPVAMAAGVATLEVLKDRSLYKKLEESSRNLSEGLEKAAKNSGKKTFHTRVGSMLCTFFTDKEVTDWDSAATSNTELYAAYFRGMLESGVYLAPSQFEAAFVSTAHGNEEVEVTIKASYEVLKDLKF